MTETTAIGLSRQIALSRALDLTANNIANQSTPGFKEQVLDFTTLQVTRDSAGPESDRDTAFAQITGFRSGMQNGVARRTDAIFDFAITGDGFFQLEDAAGPRLTRNGHFQLGPDGSLQAGDGRRVLSAGGGPLLIDRTLGPVAVSEDGTLSQAGAQIGQIGIFSVDNPSALIRKGTTAFSVEEGTPVVAVAAPRVASGFLEQSNVDALSAMTDLIKITRAYQQTAEFLEARSALSRRAIETFTETA